MPEYTKENYEKSQSGHPLPNTGQTRYCWTNLLGILYWL